MDFIGGQKPPPGAESKSLWLLVWDFFVIFTLKGKKKMFTEHLAMNSQVITSPCYLWCCFPGAVVWEAKAMAEQKLLHFNAVPTLPELQDSPTSQSFLTLSVNMGSEVQGTVDQQVS